LEVKKRKSKPAPFGKANPKGMHTQNGLIARLWFGAAPTMLRFFLLSIPALTGWANFWRAYGAF
jgi:hypothetical protein